MVTCGNIGVNLPAFKLPGIQRVVKLNQAVGAGTKGKIHHAGDGPECRNAADGHVERLDLRAPCFRNTSAARPKAPSRNSSGGARMAPLR